jgi:hypothetical protein
MTTLETAYPRGDARLWLRLWQQDRHGPGWEFLREWN